LRLLIDMDNDGTFADETPITGATSLGNNIYEFAAITGLANGLRFTLSSINTQQTLLPIDKIAFDVNPTNQQTVKINWKTTNEYNNDYFNIERSKDAIHWENLATVQSKGDGNFQYQYIDEVPYSGRSYYRLQQIDYDLNHNYTPIQTVLVDDQQASPIMVFPNPAKDKITIKGQLAPLQDIRLLNNLGQDVSNYIRLTQNNRQQAQIELSALPPGIYMLRVDNFIKKIHKQ